MRWITLTAILTLALMFMLVACATLRDVPRYW
jgi:hypothetical protein